MKKFIHNPKKMIGLIGIIVSAILLIATILLTLIILKYNRIETIIRYIGIAFIVLLWIGLTIWMIHLLSKKKLWPKVVMIIVILILSCGEFYGNYVLNRAYQSIRNMNKDSIVYSTTLLVMKDSGYNKIEHIKDLEIAISSNKDSIDGYQISKEIIDEYKLEEKNKFHSYEDYPSMVKDLYSGKVDAIFIPTSTYTSLADNKEKGNPYENIIEETTVIITKTKEIKKEKSESVNFSIDQPFTVLLMGVDTISTNIKNSAANGDSLMMVTLNPNTLNATILSIPRDTYVPITCLNNKENKITHAGWYGEKCMEETIEKFTGIDIEYYVKVDFKAVVDLVDALGGIEVDIPYSFCEQNSKRQWGANTVYVKKGHQTINGEQALAFSRNRHPNPKHCSSEWTNYYSNDFVRGQNQQTVIKAILNKIKKIRDVDTALDIFEQLSNHIDTNFTHDQILSFYNIGMAALKASSEGSEPIEMQRLYLNGRDQYIYEPSMGFSLYNYIYYTGSLDEITKAMRINLGLEEPTPITEFTFSINEKYKPQVIGKDNTTTTKIIKVLPNFVGKTKQNVLNWANTNGINVTFTTIDSSSSEHVQDEIMTQSYPTNYKLSDIPNSGINFTVVNKIGIVVPPQDPEEVDCSLEENKNLPICQVLPPTEDPTNNEENSTNNSEEA